jgi:hypothetical protein
VVRLAFANTDQQATSQQIGEYRRNDALSTHHFYVVPTGAVLGSVGLILAAPRQCGDVRRRGGRNMNGTAECDCLHAGNDQRPTLCDMRG